MFAESVDGRDFFRDGAPTWERNSRKMFRAKYISILLVSVAHSLQLAFGKIASPPSEKGIICSSLNPFGPPSEPQ